MLRGGYPEPAPGHGRSVEVMVWPLSIKLLSLLTSCSHFAVGLCRAFDHIRVTIYIYIYIYIFKV